MAGIHFSVYFDTGIEKVLQGKTSTELTYEITKSALANSSSEYGPYLKPILKSGYELYAAEGRGKWEDDCYYMDSGDTVTFTSKISASRKSVDLSTLSGWAGLSSGAHSIQLKAKATGYKDSELSQAVSVRKAEGYDVTIKFGGIYTNPIDVRGYVFYSIDNGATWLDPLQSANNFEDYIISNVKQIKLKCTSTNITYSKTEAGTGSLAGVSIYGTHGDTQVSDNILVTEESSIRFYFSD